MFLLGIDINQIIGFGIEYVPLEFFSSLIAMVFVSVVAIIVGIKAKKADPLEKPKGILNIAEIFVEFVDRNVDDIMGHRFSNFGGYIAALGLYIFTGFIVGLTGMPNPFVYLGNTMSIALISLIMIHATSVKYNKWSYFKRYIEPVPVFLPINLISMWAPFISLSFRLFGNALAGFSLMYLLYLLLTPVVNGIPIFLAQFVAPFLHMYFDLFSGLIQTLVFTMLTMIFVAQEGPEDEELVAQVR
ncbi:MAG: FoF1 ATP synthase subunit a [Bacilli bacterium]